MWALCGLQCIVLAPKSVLRNVQRSTMETATALVEAPQASTDAQTLRSCPLRQPVVGSCEPFALIMCF